MYKIAKTLCNTDNHVCPGLTCKFEMEKKLNKKYYMCGEYIINLII